MHKKTATPNFQADVAQLVEQLIRNQQVSGSIPLVGSTLQLNIEDCRLSIYWNLSFFNLLFTATQSILFGNKSEFCRLLLCALLYALCALIRGGASLSPTLRPPWALHRL
jgi:hypothetical protein